MVFSLAIENGTLGLPDELFDAGILNIFETNHCKCFQNDYVFYGIFSISYQIHTEKNQFFFLKHVRFQKKIFARIPNMDFTYDKRPLARSLSLFDKFR